MKKDIEEIIYGLNEIMQLKPVSFKWKDSQGDEKSGLVAQDV